MPCGRCARLHLECTLLAGHRKCSHCIPTGLLYDAAADNLDTLEKVDREKERIQEEIKKMETIRRENDARLARFYVLQKSLEDREIALVVQGANTLAELDRIEEEERYAAGDSNEPFDPMAGRESLDTEMSESHQVELLSQGLGAISTVDPAKQPKY